MYMETKLIVLKKKALRTYEKIQKQKSINRGLTKARKVVKGCVRLGVLKGIYKYLTKEIKRIEKEEPESDESSSVENSILSFS